MRANIRTIPLKCTTVIAILSNSLGYSTQFMIRISTTQNVMIFAEDSVLGLRRKERSWVLFALKWTS